MRTIAILPVKSFTVAKQRLAAMLGAGSRQALAQAMFSDVLASLRRVPGVDWVAVVTADRVAESAALGERVHVLRDTEQAGQSAAAELGVREVGDADAVLLVPGDCPALNPKQLDALIASVEPAPSVVIQYALGCGFDRVLLVPGDTPLLDPGEVAGLLRRGIDEDMAAVVVPDRHGEGTNALLLCPPDAIEPSFGPGSCERHMAAARERGLVCAVERVPTTLEARRGHAPSTRGALRQLDRSQAWRRPPVPA